MKRHLAWFGMYGIAAALIASGATSANGDPIQIPGRFPRSRFATIDDKRFDTSVVWVAPESLFFSSRTPPRDQLITIPVDRIRHLEVKTGNQALPGVAYGGALGLASGLYAYVNARMRYPEIELGVSAPLLIASCAVVGAALGGIVGWAFDSYTPIRVNNRWIDIVELPADLEPP